ncbi:MAG: HlyD family efflux transporter periplasmic adaptor subunit [Phycisphaeraceae bacterium]|nr:HlyD family efflux transporter periplasmic adaptor subunit [Phycisphaeraceae bacterium]
MGHEQTRTAARTLTLLDLVEQLSRFDGPPEQFVQHLLVTQCRIAPAAGGALLRAGRQGPGELLAVFPPVPAGQTAPVWLAQAVETTPAVVAAAKSAILPLRMASDLYGQPAAQHLLMLPLHGAGGVRGSAAYVLEASDPQILARAQERLELTVGLLGLYEMRVSLQRRSLDLRRMQQAMEVLAAINEQFRFRAAAMAFCNDLAAKFQSHRTSLGFLRGRYIHLQAMSHTEKFTRKMRLVQDLESAMEECLDQDQEVLFPAPAEATYVSRSVGELAARHGPSAILSLPLRRQGGAMAVVTLERPADQPFTPDQVELLRLAVDLCAARLGELFENDRWFGSRFALTWRRQLAELVGPRHTWAKAIAVTLSVALLLAMILRGTDRARADFVIQPIERQIIPAPYDGTLRTVEVEPGAQVVANQTVLATLDDTELRLQLHKAQLDQTQARHEADIAMRDGKQDDRETALSKAEALQPTIDLLTYRIQQATLRSPMTGLVMQGDLRRQIGAPVTRGQNLFEIAPQDAMRADLLVEEDRIEGVKVDQRGQLAAASYPGWYIPFQVERINPVAEVVEGRNVFRVRVRLEEAPLWLRPGMQGVGKIDVGRRSYAYLWTRDLVNWLRMWLWI